MDSRATTYRKTVNRYFAHAYSGLPVVVSPPHHFLVCVGTVYIRWRGVYIQIHRASACLSVFVTCRDPDCSVLTPARGGLSNMSPAAAFHAQLASIMEVLANTAVAEICELVDSGYSVLQLEISRSRKENEVLRRKLRLMELRAARANALRAAATASGTALLHASGRARAQPPDEPRRNGTPRGNR